MSRCHALLLILSCLSRSQRAAKKNILGTVSPENLEQTEANLSNLRNCMQSIASNAKKAICASPKSSYQLNNPIATLHLSKASCKGLLSAIIATQAAPSPCQTDSNSATIATPANLQRKRTMLRRLDPGNALEKVDRCPGLCFVFSQTSMSTPVKSSLTRRSLLEQCLLPSIGRGRNPVLGTETSWNLADGDSRANGTCDPVP